MSTGKAQAAYQKDLSILHKLANKQDNLVIKKWIEVYSQTSLPYCTPSMLAQDRSNPKQRLDDMIGGFPYTSSSFPWPRHESTARYMQPILQINLEQAGYLLDELIGEGLLQVWATQGSESPIMLRIIPKSSLKEKVEDFYPENADWEDRLNDQRVPPDSFQGLSEEGIESLMFRPRTYMMDFEEEILLKPRVKWKAAGRMFTPNIQGIYLVDSCFNSDQIDAAQEESYELLDDVVRSVTSPYNSIYLGGFGGSAGGDEDPMYLDVNEGKLLVRVSDDDGRHLGVIYKRDITGHVVFEVIDRY